LFLRLNQGGPRLIREALVGNPLPVFRLCEFELCSYVRPLLWCEVLHPRQYRISRRVSRTKLRFGNGSEKVSRHSFVVRRLFRILDAGRGGGINCTGIGFTRCDYVIQIRRLIFARIYSCFKFDGFHLSSPVRLNM